MKHRSTYQHQCKVCGAPRWDGCSRALCKWHDDDYRRRLHVQTRRNKKAGIVLPRGVHRTAAVLARHADAGGGG